MKHLAAYLLLALGGNESPSAADITKVLSSVGIEADSERLEALLAELKGKDINTLISEGGAKLASVPFKLDVSVSAQTAVKLIESLVFIIK